MKVAGRILKIIFFRDFGKRNILYFESFASKNTRLYEEEHWDVVFLEQAKVTVPLILKYLTIII